MKSIHEISYWDANRDWLPAQPAKAHIANGFLHVELESSQSTITLSLDDIRRIIAINDLP